VIPFPKYIKNYSTETIESMVVHDSDVLKRTKQGGLRASLKAKLLDCENELERRREEVIYE
jgi:hypothetical protein